MKKVETKYWKQPTNPTSSVSYYWESDAESRKDTYGACYVNVMSNSFEKKWHSILLKEAIGHLPYGEPEVKRWIADLNQLGFPCHFEGMDTHLKIRLIFNEFKSKVHLASTLMLLRILWESGMNKIPDLYFQAMDANPRADKLVQIQKAHKHPSLAYTDYGYRSSSYNSGHTATSHWNKKNIRRTELFKRFAKGGNVWTSTSTPVATTWRVDPVNKYEYRKW